MMMPFVRNIIQFLCPGYTYNYRDGIKVKEDCSQKGNSYPVLRLKKMKIKTVY